MNLNYALGYFFQSLKESLLKGQNPGKKLYCTIVKKKTKKRSELLETELWKISYLR